MNEYVLEEYLQHKLDQGGGGRIRHRTQRRQGARRAASSVSVPPENDAREKPTHTPRRWGTVVTTFVPLSTLALVLLIYGYTLAVQSVFGINAGLIAGSLAEYVQLSSHVIVHLFGATVEAFQDWGTIQRLYADLQWLCPPSP